MLVLIQNGVFPARLFNVFDILLAVSLTFLKNDFNISHAVFLERKLSTSTTTGNHQILISTTSMHVSIIIWNPHDAG